MTDISFFFKKGPFNVDELIPNIKNKLKIKNIKILKLAKKNDLSFFDSIKYKDQAIKTKAGACITTAKLKSFLPISCQAIIVKNVLFDLAKITKKFYPTADVDFPDLTVKKPNNKSYVNVKFGNNVLIGKNVKIDKSTIIGNNTIIEHDVQIGKNSVIGSNVIIKNSIIGDEVIIQDGCKIGLKGFGFIPINGENYKFPHIGKVIIKNKVEIGSSCTIDRGSIDDTIIEENTYLDNQVHVAHNVHIGKNCMIAGQVGFAGSSILGNNVSIGGQAGISGHLKIGNNVKIGGGSGVVKDIPDGIVVMGYPAMPLKEFIRNLKKLWLIQ